MDGLFFHTNLNSRFPMTSLPAKNISIPKKIVFVYFVAAANCFAIHAFWKKVDETGKQYVADIDGLRFRQCQ